MIYQALKRKKCNEIEINNGYLIDINIIVVDNNVKNG